MKITVINWMAHQQYCYQSVIEDSKGFELYRSHICLDRATAYGLALDYQNMLLDRAQGFSND